MSESEAGAPEEKYPDPSREEAQDPANDAEGVEKVEPTPSGYKGRDPKTQMPRFPGEPEKPGEDY